MKIYLVRHGQTTGDIEDRYGGAYDDHLSDKGREQSERLGQHLCMSGIQVIYASPLVRAQETAHFLAQNISCPVIERMQLKERNQYGKLSGMVKSEAKMQFPDLVKLFDDRLNTIRGAESYEDFSARITGEFVDIANDTQFHTIAIVTHGGPLRVIFRDVLQWGELNAIGDCSFVELEKEGQAFRWIRSEGLKPDFHVR